MITNVSKDSKAEIAFSEDENEKLRRLIYFIKKGMAFSYIKASDLQLIYAVNALDELCDRQRKHIEATEKSKN